MEQELTQEMRQLLISWGVIAYKEQESLFSIARRCTKVGVLFAGTYAGLGAGAGTIVLPGIGTVTGAAASALTGLVHGTMICTGVNIAVRNELKKLAENGEDVSN